MSSVQKKRIRIPGHGPIWQKGGLIGPINSPYYEDIHTIASMIMAKREVIEVIKDGVEVTLTLANYDKDNSIVFEPIHIETEVLTVDPTNKEEGTKTDVTVDEIKDNENNIPVDDQKSEIAEDTNGQETTVDNTPVIVTPPAPAQIINVQPQQNNRPNNQQNNFKNFNNNKKNNYPQNPNKTNTPSQPIKADVLEQA